MQTFSRCEQELNIGDENEHIRAPLSFKLHQDRTTSAGLHI